MARKSTAWGNLTFGEISGELNARMTAEVDTLGQAAAQVPPTLVKEMLSQL